MSEFNERTFVWLAAVHGLATSPFPAVAQKTPLAVDRSASEQHQCAHVITVRTLCWQRLMISTAICISRHHLAVIRMCERRHGASTMLACRCLSCRGSGAQAEAERVGHAEASGKAQQGTSADAGASSASEAAPHEPHRLTSFRRQRAGCATAACSARGQRPASRCRAVRSRHPAGA